MSRNFQPPSIEVHAMVRQPHGPELLQWGDLQVPGVKLRGVPMDEALPFRLPGKDDFFRLCPSPLQAREGNVEEQAEARENPHRQLHKVSSALHGALTLSVSLGYLAIVLVQPSHRP